MLQIRKIFINAILPERREIDGETMSNFCKELQPLAC